MITRPAAQRIAELLIRAACRRLPGDVREDRRREWSAELLAILDDPGVRVAALRRARALRYAAGICRSAGRLHRPAPGAAVAAPVRWASRSRRRPLNRPKLAGGALPAVAAVLLWVSAVVLLHAYPPHGGAEYPALAASVAAQILAVVAVVRFVRWLRRRGDHQDGRYTPAARSATGLPKRPVDSVILCLADPTASSPPSA